MTGHSLILFMEWLFFLYFIAISAGYVLLNIISVIYISRYMNIHSLQNLPRPFSGFEPPVSILVPAHNEELSIVNSVRALLQLTYPSYEVLVINDGSTDRTLQVLSKEFSLIPVPVTFHEHLPAARIKGEYFSKSHPNIRVIDKENGGKADALNAGLNFARHNLFCSVDADSILQRDSLQQVVYPFLEDPTTVASGGTVRIANGSTIREGFLVETGLPGNLLARFQVVEYLRAFLFGRMGWSPLNALMIISGAFGLFRKDAVIEVGGYRKNTIGEDMELVVRLHRKMRLAEKPYRISFVPDPICWTEAPEDLGTLRVQRMRWQRGLTESLFLNINLLFHEKGGTVGWLAFPFFLIFECLGPILEVVGYIYMTVLFYYGLLPNYGMLAFLIVTIGLGILLSICALMLEEMSFHLYPRLSHVFKLFVAAVAENIGYRQINSFWRLAGIIGWLFGKKASWGEMKRVGSTRSHD